MGYETDSVTCYDDIDNDFDGMIDCRDPDCIARSFCSKVIPMSPVDEPENTFARCTDRIDNDNDGNWDCGDRNCQSIGELCCTNEVGNLACSDGVDNDDNGFRDCNDFSCRRNPFASVCGRESQCDNGRDDDGDRFIDCNDSDCAAAANCLALPRDPEDTPERCTDGVDNDRDGFVDCRERSCCGDATCSSPLDDTVRDYCAERLETTPAQCMDGVDNDGNGFTDCGDFSCCDRDGVCLSDALRTYCDERMPTTELPEEDGYDECRDGLDNDRDGFPDCSDFSCRSIRQPRPFMRGDSVVMLVASPCQETVIETDVTMFPLRAVAEAIDRCSNGIDEDSDGFIDCDDFDCHWDPLLKPPFSVSGNEEGFCQGWRHNNGNGEWTLSGDSRRPLYCRGS